MALSIKLSGNNLDQTKCLNFLQKSGSDSNFICQGFLSNKSESRKVIDVDYNKFGETTLKKLHQIADESCKRFRLSKALIHQRIGSVEPDSPILILAFAANDPTNAYQAYQFALQKLQSQFPMWQNEQLELNQIGQRRAQA